MVVSTLSHLEAKRNVRDLEIVIDVARWQIADKVAQRFDIEDPDTDRTCCFPFDPYSFVGDRATETHRGFFQGLSGIRRHIVVGKDVDIMIECFIAAKFFPGYPTVTIFDRGAPDNKWFIELFSQVLARLGVTYGLADNQATHGN